MVIYVAREGDVLDWICWKHYGTTDVIEKIIEINPKVSAERLTAGTVVRLPYIDVVLRQDEGIRLWS